MRIPRYWSRATHSDGGSNPVTALGWSFESQAEADRAAKERAAKAFANRRDREMRSYPYGERLLCEEIVKELDGGAITRNRYGALVLNTAQLFFADIDTPDVRPRGLIDSVRSLFGGRAAREQEARDQTRKRVEEWLSRRQIQAFRLYRTAAGLRLMLLDRAYAPDDSTTVRILEELGSDERYRLLTRSQQCFRARLTPKPWRCGCRRPPTVYPWSCRELETKQRDWEREYGARCADYGVCELLNSAGEADDVELTRLVRLHDQHALCAGKPLA